MTTTTTRQGLPLLPAYRGVTVELTPRYGQHWYRVTGYDDLLPSVTTVLKVIDKSGPLVGWAKKTALESVRSALHEYAAGPFVYAGTVDLVARNKAGELVVADWKRSKGLYAEHAYQVAGYADAIETITGEPVVAAYAVRLPRTTDEEAEYEKVWAS